MTEPQKMKNLPQCYADFQVREAVRLMLEVAGNRENAKREIKKIIEEELA